MPRFKHHVTLILRRRTEQEKHRILRSPGGKEEVITPIHHQHGYLDARSEVDGVHFRQRLSKPPPTNQPSLIRGSIEIMMGASAEPQLSP